MIDNRVSKVYYARVLGDFRTVCSPDPAKVASVDEVADASTKLQCVVDLSVYCVSNVDAVWDCAKLEDVPFEFRPKAKEAQTLFEFVFYDSASNHSVIMCYPRTGRTHQIRVHLKSLGFPIAND